MKTRRKVRKLRRAVVRPRIFAGPAECGRCHKVSPVAATFWDETPDTSRDYAISQTKLTRLDLCEICEAHYHQVTSRIRNVGRAIQKRLERKNGVSAANRGAEKLKKKLIGIGEGYLDYLDDLSELERWEGKLGI